MGRVPATVPILLPPATKIQNSGTVKLEQQRKSEWRSPKLAIGSAVMTKQKRIALQKIYTRR